MPPLHKSVPPTCATRVKKVWTRPCRWELVNGHPPSGPLLISIKLVYALGTMHRRSHTGSAWVSDNKDKMKQSQNGQHECVTAAQDGIKKPPVSLNRGSEYMSAGTKKGEKNPHHWGHWCFYVPPLRLLGLLLTAFVLQLTKQCLTSVSAGRVTCLSSEASPGSLFE